MGFTILCSTLSQALKSNVIPIFFVKGGVAIELRLGLRARATRDVDIGLCADTAELIPVFDRALAVGFGDFILRRRGEARVLDNGVRRIEIALEYVGRPWATIDVDLAPANQDASTDAVAPISLRDLGIDGVPSIPCLSLEEQAAQKIHALTEPEPFGRPNPRARDVVDILLLEDRLGFDYETLAIACERIFSERALHTWPVHTFAFPPAWMTTMIGPAGEAGYYDIQALQTRFNILLARLTGAPHMPNYEYLFVALSYNWSTLPDQFRTPIETQDSSYSHFQAYIDQGWRVHTLNEFKRPGMNPQLLVLLEREKPKT